MQKNPRGCVIIDVGGRERRETRQEKTRQEKRRSRVEKRLAVNKTDGKQIRLCSYYTESRKQRTEKRVEFTSILS